MISFHFWLVYMLYKILFFLLKEIFKFSLEKTKDLSINLGYSSIFCGILSFSLGNTILGSAISSIFGTILGAGYGIYSIKEKGKKIINLILIHLIENHFDFFIQIYYYIFDKYIITCCINLN